MKISVCMAVFNGESYLLAQIESILVQLRATDELVIIDDASQDNSLELLKNINDSRIHIYHNTFNLGILASFEKALRLAQGDILFLSDQDDIWLAGKVKKIIDVFLLDFNTTLVVSDARIIDTFGHTVAESFFAQRHKEFTKGVLTNLISNKYLGCTLAFRQSMLKYFLPIPSDVPMHDMWFGILNDIYGSTYYINEPLIAYRRHINNVSPAIGASFTQQFIWRWRLVKNLFLRILSYRFSKL
ncbi:MAG: glycosyltransferase family 2 protein [Methylococcales bacterium]|nr:glycosyltransferase family 2 protein [Methylococcales bacterium]